MLVYFVRHADAERSSPDNLRKLTEAGITEFENNLSTWRDKNPSISHLVTSPLVRAVETSNIIMKYFSLDNGKEISEKLSPGSRLADIIDMINESDGGSIVFVGHLPDLANHISDLVSNSGMRISFSPGAIACIAFSGAVRAGAGKLVYLIQSRE